MSGQENQDYSADVSEQQISEQQQNGAENPDHGENGAGTAAGDSGENGANQESQESRKLFVGGLSRETTDKELREHFSTFGPIETINVKTDPNTGHPRGFAFILFTNAEALEKAMNHGEHTVNNKKVDVKKAKARPGKIFVARLTSELTDDDIKTYFGKFGAITEVEMPFDKTKNQRKGFCFITYESQQVAKEVLKNSKQSINGHVVEVKKATPRADAPTGRGGPGARGGRGGRGAPRGGARGYAAQGGWAQAGYGGYGAGYDSYGPGYDYYSAGYGGGYGDYGYAGYGAAPPAPSFAGKQRGGNRGGARQNQRAKPY